MVPLLLMKSYPCMSPEMPEIDPGAGLFQMFAAKSGCVMSMPSSMMPTTILELPVVVFHAVGAPIFVNPYKPRLDEHGLEIFGGKHGSFGGKMGCRI